MPSPVGDFNDWGPMATPLRKEGNVRSATITLLGMSTRNGPTVMA